MARASARASYTADYAVTGAGFAAGPASLRVSVRPPAYRVDLTTADVTSVLLSSGNGPVSCRIGGRPTTCFQVAAKGQPVPELFDAGVQRVFTSYLTTLAGGTVGYVVAEVPPPMPRPGMPAGRCFTVRAATGTRPTVANGTYCLTEAGMPTSVTFPSGAMTLVRTSAPPEARYLQPPSSPTPLPKA